MARAASGSASTSPIAAAVATTENVDYVTSQSTPSASVVSVHMKLGSNPDVALTEVLSKVQSVRGELPEEAEDPTIVKGTVPASGFGSTALQSQIKMLDAAGKHVFNIRFIDLYGMNPDQLNPWNSFLSGQLDAKGLTKAMQQVTDKVANDSSVKKVEIK